MYIVLLQTEKTPCGMLTELERKLSFFPPTFPRQFRVLCWSQYTGYQPKQHSLEAIFFFIPNQCFRGGLQNTLTGSWVNYFQMSSGGTCHFSYLLNTDRNEYNATHTEFYTSLQKKLQVTHFTFTAKMSRKMTWALAPYCLDRELNITPSAMLNTPNDWNLHIETSQRK